MFTPKCKRGLGIPQPHALYYDSRLSFILSVLNSDDMCVRQCARDSLALHMTKRKVPPAIAGQPSFAGYSVVNEKLNKTTKVISGPSQRMFRAKITVLKRIKNIKTR